jgi:hypothetical protein
MALMTAGNEPEIYVAALLRKFYSKKKKKILLN